MPIVRTVEPGAEPVTLAQAKAHLRVDYSADDDLISALISAARQQCEHRTQRTLVNTTWRLSVDAFEQLALLPMGPVTAITSLSYVDANGTTQTLSSGTDYRADLDSAPARVQPINTWPTAADQLNAVTITYTAGYGASGASVPAPLRQWILLAVGEMYAHRARSDERPAVAHDFVDGLLDPFRTWG